MKTKAPARAVAAIAGLGAQSVDCCAVGPIVAPTRLQPLTLSRTQLACGLRGGLRAEMSNKTRGRLRLAHHHLIPPPSPHSPPHRPHPPSPPPSPIIRHHHHPITTATTPPPHPLPPLARSLWPRRSCSYFPSQPAHAQPPTPRAPYARAKSRATTTITTIANNAHSAATPGGGRAANGGNYVRT